MSTRPQQYLLTGLLCLGACSEKAPVVIQAGVFSDAWPTELRGKLVKNKRCFIDQVNGKPLAEQSINVRSGQMLSFSGWAFSEADGAQPNVYVQLVGPALTYTALAQKRTARPDVNQYFKLDVTWNTGFELEAVQNIEPGEYRIEVLQPGKSGVAQCDKNLSLDIKPANR